MDITFVNAPDEIEACLAVRHAVFVLEQCVSLEDELDGLEDQSRHVLATLDGAAIGAARVRQSGSDWKVQRVCVAQKARGTGLGQKIMRFIEDQARADGAVTALRLSAQTSAIGFYEQLGYSAYGDIYPDAGIPHRDMVLRLDQSK